MCVCMCVCACARCGFIFLTSLLSKIHPPPKITSFFYYCSPGSTINFARFPFSAYRAGWHAEPNPHRKLHLTHLHTYLALACTAHQPQSTHTCTIRNRAICAPLLCPKTVLLSMAHCCYLETLLSGTLMARAKYFPSLWSYSLWQHVSSIGSIFQSFRGRGVLLL